jgi:hypothetical protein
MRLVTVSILCVLMTACGGPSTEPEEALRQWIAEAEAAAEDLDRRGLVSMVSGRYADARGNDREAVDRLLRLYFLRQKSVVLVVKIDKLTVMDETAAEVLVTAAGVGMTTRALGVNADSYQFLLELEKEGDEWMLIGARWGEPGQELH